MARVEQPREELAESRRSSGAPKDTFLSHFVQNSLDTG
jgi:hypothetical protein